MAVKSSGSLSITTDIVGEFGGQAPHSLSEYYRNGANVPDAGANSAVPTSGEISFADFYGAVSELGVTITSTQDSLNLLSAIEAVYGTQSAASVYRVTVDSGVTIGGTSSSPNNSAVTWGDFPDGSTVTLVNNGAIEGKAGAQGTGGAGGTGGDAVYANYANQTMNITNNGNLFAGGGGGGLGGAGGTGGQGQATAPTPAGSYTPYYFQSAGGSLLTNPPAGSSAAQFLWSPSPGPVYNFQDTYSDSGGGAQINLYWSSSTAVYRLITPGPTTRIYANVTTRSNVNGYDYSRGNFQGNFIVYGGTFHHSIRRRTSAGPPSTQYYPGGAGGAGGAGGFGDGYNQSNTAGTTGTSGSAGGTNAGAGGTGGTGGTGGPFGVGGSTGATGNAGANGNYTNGLSGSGGSSGGAAGRYIIKGSNTVTITGSGTTAGGVA
jgi:hypothetical protein